MSTESGADRDVARAYLDTARRLLDAVNIDEVIRVVEILRGARERSATVFIAGNGGSAATASHFATDLSRVTAADRHVRALSLTDNVAWITALANDEGYARAFAGQADRLIQPGDVLIAISASGNSPSALEVVGVARRRGATTIAFVGFDGGELLRSVDAVVHVPSALGVYGPVEDVHLSIQHLVTACLARN